MRSIAHKVKVYNRTFYPVPATTLRSRIFWLIGVLLVAIIGGFYWYFIDRDHRYGVLLATLFVSEIVAALGWLQLFLETEKRRFEKLRGYPAASTRAAVREMDRERMRTIEELFQPQHGIDELARSLISEWEWGNDINMRAGDPAAIRVGRFFSIPSGSTLATYLAGAFAIFAAVIVTTLDRETIFNNLPSIWPDFKQLWWALFKFSLVIAALAIPAQMLWSTLQLLWQWLGQQLHDDYLSDRSFYRFIRYMLETSDNRERRLLTTSKGAAYWLVQMTTAPLGQLRGRQLIFKRARHIQQLSELRARSVPEHSALKAPSTA